MKTFKSFINESSIAQDYVAPKDSDDEVKDIKPRSKGEEDFKNMHKMTHTKHPVAGDHQFDGSINSIKEEVEDEEISVSELEEKCKSKGKKEDVNIKIDDEDDEDEDEMDDEEDDDDEKDLKESKGIAFSDLQGIAKAKKSGRVKFDNGKMETVDADTAKQIVTVLNKLNPNNKKKAIATLNKDPAGLMKVLDIVNKA